MLANVSYNDKKLIAEINDLVGFPFNLIDILKHRGVGSPKFKIIKADEQIKELLNRDNNLKSCNIELRPKGIIIRFRSVLETYGLVIPFHKLVIFKPAHQVTFHYNQHFITLEANDLNGTVKFMKKVQNLKMLYLGNQDRFEY